MAGGDGGRLGRTCACEAGASASPSASSSAGREAPPSHVSLNHANGDRGLGRLAPLATSHAAST
jgi:hypothetical protein